MKMMPTYMPKPHKHSYNVSIIEVNIFLISASRLNRI